MNYTIHTGDCLDIMKTMQENSVDSIITDPPYGLGFMNKDWDHGVPGSAYWKEALRVAKPGAHLLAFGGTRTFHRLMVAIEDAGWEIRDTIMWTYGTGFPKSRNLDGEWDGWGTALKPAWEPIVVARRPLQGTVENNVSKYGTGALNIDASRIESGEDYVNAGWGSRFSASSGQRASGDSRPWSDERVKNGEVIKNSQPSPHGRWPANLIHDGSDEVTQLFPNAGGGYGVSGGTSDGHGIYGKSFPRGDMSVVGYGDAGSAARFYYVAKASVKDREEGLEDLQAVVKNDGRDETLASGNMPQNRSNNPKKNHHPTVKPTQLMRYLVKLVTPPGAVVLDPFMGSGSTGKAAMLENAKFIGIDITQEYVEIARRRIEHAIKQQKESNDNA